MIERTKNERFLLEVYNSSLLIADIEIPNLHFSL